MSKYQKGHLKTQSPAFHIPLDESTGNTNVNQSIVLTNDHFNKQGDTNNPLSDPGIYIVAEGHNIQIEDIELSMRLDNQGSMDDNTFNKIFEEISKNTININDLINQDLENHDLLAEDLLEKLQEYLSNKSTDDDTSPSTSLTDAYFTFPNDTHLKLVKQENAISRFNTISDIVTRIDSAHRIDATTTQWSSIYYVNNTVVRNYTREYLYNQLSSSQIEYYDQNQELSWQEEKIYVEQQIAQAPITSLNNIALRNQHRKDSANNISDNSDINNTAEVEPLAIHSIVIEPNTIESSAIEVAEIEIKITDAIPIAPATLEIDILDTNNLEADKTTSYNNGEAQIEEGQKKKKKKKNKKKKNKEKEEEEEEQAQDDPDDQVDQKKIELKPAPVFKDEKNQEDINIQNQKLIDKLKAEFTPEIILSIKNNINQDAKDLSKTSYILKRKQQVEDDIKKAENQVDAIKQKIEQISASDKKPAETMLATARDKLAQLKAQLLFLEDGSTNIVKVFLSTTNKMESYIDELKNVMHLKSTPNDTTQTISSIIKIKNIIHQLMDGVPQILVKFLDIAASSKDPDHHYYDYLTSDGQIICNIYFKLCSLKSRIQDIFETNNKNASIHTEKDCFEYELRTLSVVIKVFNIIKKEEEIGLDEAKKEEEASLHEMIEKIHASYAILRYYVSQDNQDISANIYEGLLIFDLCYVTHRLLKSLDADFQNIDSLSNKTHKDFKLKIKDIQENVDDFKKAYRKCAHGVIKLQEFCFKPSITKNGIKITPHKQGADAGTPVLSYQKYDKLQAEAAGKIMKSQTDLFEKCFIVLSNEEKNSALGQVLRNTIINSAKLLEFIINKLLNIKGLSDKKQKEYKAYLQKSANMLKLLGNSDIQYTCKDGTEQIEAPKKKKNKKGKKDSKEDNVLVQAQDDPDNQNTQQKPELKPTLPSKDESNDQTQLSRLREKFTTELSENLKKSINEAKKFLSDSIKNHGLTLASDIENLVKMISDAINTGSDDSQSRLEKIKNNLPGAASKSINCIDNLYRLHIVPILQEYKDATEITEAQIKILQKKFKLIIEVYSAISNVMQTLEYCLDIRIEFLDEAFRLTTTMHIMHIINKVEQKPLEAAEPIREFCYFKGTPDDENKAEKALSKILKLYEYANQLLELQQKQIAQTANKLSHPKQNSEMHEELNKIKDQIPEIISFYNTCLRNKVKYVISILKLARHSDTMQSEHKSDDKTLKAIAIIESCSGFLEEQIKVPDYAVQERAFIDKLSEILKTLIELKDQFKPGESTEDIVCLNKILANIMSEVSRNKDSSSLIEFIEPTLTLKEAEMCEKTPPMEACYEHSFHNEENSNQIQISGNDNFKFGCGPIPNFNFD